MLSWLKRLFRRCDSEIPGKRNPGPQPSSFDALRQRFSGPIPDDRRAPADSALTELFSREREAKEKAWWKDKTSVVAETDEQFAVIGPRADATAEDLKSIGQRLKQWQETHGYARHIWGLDDLLEGRCPRTPPIYLEVPYPGGARFAEYYEPVALVFVAQGTDHKQAGKSLAQALGKLRSRLAWFTDPMNYSNENR